jgi:tRNA threonylcarbamoyladenosine biosynthesis protein TsaE
MSRLYTLNNIDKLDLTIKQPSLIFVKWDLWAGKTTLTKYIINNLLKESWNIISPTYTYYNKYNNIYHFDLYKLKSYDEFFAIGGEDILDNNNWVIIVEWPELLEKYYKADIEISLSITWKEDEREISIKYKK